MPVDLKTKIVLAIVGSGLIWSIATMVLESVN